MGTVIYFHKLSYRRITYLSFTNYFATFEPFKKQQKMKNNNRIGAIMAIASVAFFASCSNGPKSESFIANIETHSCAADTSIHYSLYTPKSDGQKLPAIIFFDPHTHGQIPVAEYAQLASEYNYLLIGSNDLHNGQSATNTSKIVSGLINEAISQCNADENRIYLCGFSGGAKIAMMYGLSLPEINGVIACGGSIAPSVRRDSTFCFVGIVGNKDFNYLDMQQTLAQFSKLNIPFTSVVFDGRHEWPSASDFRNAFIALEINAMRVGEKPANVEWLKSIYNAMGDSVNNYMAMGSYAKASEYIGRIQGWFGSVDKDIRLSAFLSNLNSNYVYQNYLEKIQNLAAKEVALRGQFINSVETRDLDWWKNEIENFNKSISSNDEQVSLTSQRLMAYLSMMSFSLASNEISSNNAESAYKRLQIYEMVDPDNTDVYLLYARYYLLINDREQMVANYKKAVDKGFTDFDQYASDPSWKMLFAQPEICR